MTEFHKRKIINRDDLGGKLKSVRELRQIDIELAARKTGIRIDYLKAIEENHFSVLPSGLYTKNYIKKYASLLGLSKEEINNWLKDNLDINQSLDPFSQKILRKKEFIVFPKLFKNIAFVIIFLVFLFYLGTYFRKIVFPPELTIYHPQQNLKTTENFIEIKGATEKEAEVSINGELVLSNNNGEFSSNIKLKKGVNNIIITAKKKYSREASILRQILVE